MNILLFLTFVFSFVTAILFLALTVGDIIDGRGPFLKQNIIIGLCIGILFTIYVYFDIT